LGNTIEQEKLDCPRELLKYEKFISDYETYTAEFYYLLGDSFAKIDNKEKALYYLNKGRKLPIFDQKVLNILELLTLSFKLY
jgi:hypothetical protein